MRGMQSVRNSRLSNRATAFATSFIRLRVSSLLIYDDIPRSIYCKLFLPRFSALTISNDFSARCWMNISVAIVMTKAALLEQLAMSSSVCMIFLMRAT